MFLKRLNKGNFSSRSERENDENGGSICSQELSDVPSNIIIQSRIKYGTKWAAFKAVFAEYSKSTSVHGIRYIFEVHRPRYEKSYWIISMAISLFFAFFFMWTLYLRWLVAPVIIGFDETLVPVHRIPFPTITICPEIKINTDIFNFENISEEIWRELKLKLEIDKANNQAFTRVNNFANINQKDVERFQAALQLCESEVYEKFAPYIIENSKIDVAKHYFDMAVPLNTTMPFCTWNNRYYFCTHIMNYILTNEGVCYQFNGLEPQDLYRQAEYGHYFHQLPIDFNNYFDVKLPKYNNISGTWSLENGYEAQGFNSYPQRSIISAAPNGFFALLIGVEHNYDYTCRNFRQGYKIFLNSPESVPLTTGNYISVPHDFEVLISIIPQYIVSTETLRDFEPDKRQCFFNEERFLRFFKSYSQKNCQTECLTNFTITKCGCVKFWMPKPPDIPICGLHNIACYNAAEEELNFIILNDTKRKTFDGNVKIMCNCMPACNSLDYDYEISTAFYDVEATVRAYRETQDDTDSRTSRLCFYFKESQFTAIKRTVLFGVTTLIANFGGIFGLFMGISSLSFIEFLYFFTLRLYNNLRKRRLIKKKLMQDEENIF